MMEFYSISGSTVYVIEIKGVHLVVPERRLCQSVSAFGNVLTPALKMSDPSPVPNEFPTQVSCASLWRL